MLNILTEVHKRDTGLKAIVKALADLKKYEVLVGIPDENAGRSVQKGPVSNAELLYIHTNGSPVRHIPPRPVLEPSIRHNKRQIAEELKKAHEAALAGNAAGIEPALSRAGKLGMNVAKGWFANPANSWAPNSPLTMRMKGSVNPLIDTGGMRKAITYKVKKG